MYGQLYILKANYTRNSHFDVRACNIKFMKCITVYVVNIFKLIRFHCFV